jgi:hypothetical protein
MAITFPLALSQFANVIAKTSVKFWLAGNMQTSGQAGNLIVADLAPKYWAAEVGMINMSNAEAMGVQAMIESLDEGLNDFYLYDPRCAYPQYDPDGSIIGSSTITNTDVATNGKVMDFTGFPNNYVLSPGDMFSFDFGSGGIYRALHRVVVGGTANSSGDLNNVEFRPRLADPNLGIGKTMTFKRPSARMKMIPGSFDPGTAKQTMTTGMSFKCRQVPGG